MLCLCVGVGVGVNGQRADGRWPADQVDALVGPWRAAAEKMHGIVEDVGWKLVLPDEEEEEEEGAEAA